MPAIVALVPPDTKAARRIDKAPLNPNGRKLRKFEKDGEAKLYDALQKWGRALFRGVTADTVALLTARLDDPEFNKPLRDVLIMFLQDVADAGAEHGREQVERVFMGVKRIPDVAAGAVDWTAANADAAQWAIEYGYQLIGGITDTTRAQIAREIRYFVDNGITINQLRDRLMAGNLFSRNRAEMIAVTEVTRAFAEGNEAAWRTSKVVEKKEWMTAFDEIVCPICGPLSGMIVPINESFGRINKPPAHPRCRCYILPVVAGDDEVLSPVGLGPWTTGGAGQVAQAMRPVAPVFTNIGDAREWILSNNIPYADTTNEIIDLMWEHLPTKEGTTKEKYYKNWRRILKDSQASEEFRLRVANDYAAAFANGDIGKDLPFIVRRSVDDWDGKWVAGFYNQDHYMVVYENSGSRGLMGAAKEASDYLVSDRYTSRLRGVITHEYGHHFTLSNNPQIAQRARAALGDIGSNTETAQWIGQNISRYAASSGDELAAEVYAFYHGPQFDTATQDVKRFVLEILGVE